MALLRSAQTLLVLAAMAMGCARPPGQSAPDGTSRGAALYASLCASCHGARGEGGGAPRLRGWSRGETELAGIIDARMPPSAPGACDATCARDVARHVVTAFQSELACTAQPPQPRGLRLLSRRELQATLADLPGLGGPAAAGMGAACGLTRFTFVPPQGRTVTTVHVAGSFNNWAATIASGGYALVPQGDRFTLERQLPPGQHLYKFVLDEKDWTTDPANPRRAPDGYGGENSLLEISCPGDCGRVRFTFDPGTRPVSRVHVSGTFNGWAPTAALGGYPLSRTGNLFHLDRTIPDGQHLYKFVLDDTEWIPDPGNPRRTPDGYGGGNSLLDVDCAGGAGSGSPLAAAFSSYPKESRPEGFAFDDHGPSRVVGTGLAEAIFRVARTAADAADLRAMLGCTVADPACVKGFVTRTGRRVFRRSLTPAETQRYEALALGAPDPVRGARLALRAMLTSPAFLYRTELGEPSGDRYVLTGDELASALSYALTGSAPDDLLLDAAASGELSTPAGRGAQARRLLATPRARTHLGDFAAMWTGADGILTADKQPSQFPADSPSLRAAMRTETAQLFAHVVFDGTHRVDELYTANYSFVSGELATHYGLAAPQATPSRITYPDGSRSGILGHASILGTAAHSDQSSPIRRGLFVRRNLLCQELPPPPPDVGSAPQVDPHATTRERFAQHTSNPACASCHRHIDPVGFGFERFDALGRLRDSENGRPVDPAGDMTDVEALGAGTSAPFQDLAALGRTLAGSKAAHACLARQAYRFTRGLLEQDPCVTLPYEEHLRQAGGDIRELLVELVSSNDFAERR